MTFALFSLCEDLYVVYLSIIVLVFSERESSVQLFIQSCIAWCIPCLLSFLLTAQNEVHI